MRSSSRTSGRSVGGKLRHFDEHQFDCLPVRRRKIPITAEQPRDARPIDQVAGKLQVKRRQRQRFIVRDLDGRSAPAKNHDRPKGRVMQEERAKRDSHKPVLAVWVGDDGRAAKAFDAAAVPYYSSETDAICGFIGSSARPMINSRAFGRTNIGWTVTPTRRAVGRAARARRRISSVSASTAFSLVRLSRTPSTSDLWMMSGDRTFTTAPCP